ncbi:MAG: hypothetical protein IJI97_05760 [Clostridia bacterium]|nr:hypothetical protein [Clostridia bacterium]
MTDDGAGPEVLWDESGSREEVPDQFSPDQVSPSYVRRFASRQAPTALVLVCAYVIREETDLANGTWNIEQQVKRIVGTDPADVQGTEVWSDTAYTKGSMNGDPLIAYEDAWLDARYRIEEFHQENIGWNGQAT